MSVKKTKKENESIKIMKKVKDLHEILLCRNQS